MSENRWDNFAKQDAEYYICTSDLDYSTPEGQDAFWKSGRAQVDHMLETVSPYLHGYRLALDIGCGIGRLSIPMAERFERVASVDVSPSMLTKLAANAERNEIDTIVPNLPDGPWDKLGSVDFAASCHVFQHIESWETIADYVHRLGGCLAEGGVAYLHFDTRPADLLYRVRPFVPDRLLPRPWRRGIRRVRRPRQQLLDLVRAAGLVVLEEHAPDTGDHVLVLGTKA